MAYERQHEWNLPLAKSMYEAGETLAAIGKVFGIGAPAMCTRLNIAWPDRPRRSLVQLQCEVGRRAARAVVQRRASQHRKEEANARRALKLLSEEEQREARRQLAMRRRAERQKMAAYNRAESRHKLRKKHRAEAIAAYGGCCACCGERNVCFLTLDHVNNDGSKDRRENGSGEVFYQWLKKHHYPQDGRVQVLCMNCNFAKAFDPVGHRQAHPNAILIDGYGDNPKPTRTRKYKEPPK